MLQDNHPGEMVLPGHMDQGLKDRGDEEGRRSVVCRADHYLLAVSFSAL